MSLCDSADVAGREKKCSRAEPGLTRGIGAARDSAVGAVRRQLGTSIDARADYCFDPAASTKATSARRALVAATSRCVPTCGPRRAFMLAEQAPAAIARRSPSSSPSGRARPDDGSVAERNSRAPLCPVASIAASGTSGRTYPGRPERLVSRSASGTLVGASGPSSGVLSSLSPSAGFAQSEEPRKEG
jgi:hypothetical protein